MQYCAPMGVYAAAAGYRQLTFGGQALPAGICIACIAPKRSDPTKYLVAILFAAHGTVGLSTAVGRAKASIYKAQFKGMNDLARTAGRQMGVLYETL